MDTTETHRYRIYFAIGTDTWGRRLESSTAVRAASREEAIDIFVATNNIPREAITGSGRDD